MRFCYAYKTIAHSHYGNILCFSTSNGIYSIFSMHNKDETSNCYSSNSYVDMLGTDPFSYPMSVID